MVEDQPLITMAYEPLPDEYPEIKKMIMARTEEEYWTAINKNHRTIDVVVMDLMLDTHIPIAIRSETKVRFTGFSLMEETLEKYPDIKFVVHSQYMHDTNILAAYRIGAKCFIAKHELSIDSFVDTLKKVVNEGLVIPDQYKRNVTNKIVGYQDEKLCQLNDEELTIVDMLINGYETDDIRQATNSKSSAAINNRISKILRTIDVPSRSVLLLYAMKAGMTPKEAS